MRFHLSAALACAVCTHAAMAAEPPIVVTATRLNADTASVPANVTVITAADIANSPAKTLPELLGDQAGVLTRSIYGNNAARATVDIRGFGATGTQNTLILLDGRRLNDIDLSAVDFAAIPVQDIERIEIIRGGGGVLYGDGAVGGTINIITKHSGKSGTSGSASVSAGSYGTREVDGDVNHTDAAYTLHAAAQAVNSDGYRANNTLRQRNLEADLSLPHANGEWFLHAGSDSQRLRLPGARTVDPGAGVDQLASDRRGTATPNDWANQTGRRLSGGFSHYWDNGTEAVVDVGYRTKNQKAFLDDYAYGGMYANYLDSDLTTWSITPRFTLTQPVFGHNAHTVLGIDYYHSSYSSNRALNPATIATPVHRLNVTQKSAAAYAQSRITLTDATDVTAGIRLQNVALHARDAYDASAPGGSFGSQAAPRDTTHTEPMWELGLRHNLTDTMSAFGRVGRSVRFVTIDETFQTNPNTYIKEFTPLAPQTALHADLGLNYALNKAKFSATAYYMQLKNEIAYDPSIFANINLDPTKRYGLELSARLPVGAHLELHASYTNMRAQFRDGPNAGNDVPLVPRQTASIGMHWQFRSTDWLSAVARYTGSKYFDNDQANNFGQKIPAYTLVDLAAGHRWQHWTVTAAVHNLFNRKVFDYGVRSLSTAGKYNAYPLPERNVTLSVSRQF